MHLIHFFLPYLQAKQLLWLPVCFPVQEVVYSKRKEFAPKRSKFFPFRVHPFSERMPAIFDSCLC